MIYSLIMMFGQHFALKDFGCLHYFFGVEASWIMDGNLHLSQTKYITDLLQRTTMLSLKLQPMPMISSSCLTQDGSTAVLDASLYKSIVGSLQYILLTRPKLAYSVNSVSIHA